jgi:hypothetical protein
VCDAVGFQTKKGMLVWKVKNGKRQKGKPRKEVKQKNKDACVEHSSLQLRSIVAQCD